MKRPEHHRYRGSAKAFRSVTGLKEHADFAWEAFFKRAAQVMSAVSRQSFSIFQHLVPSVVRDFLCEDITYNLKAPWYEGMRHSSKSVHADCFDLLGSRERADIPFRFFQAISPSSKPWHCDSAILGRHSLSRALPQMGAKQDRRLR